MSSSELHLEVRRWLRFAREDLEAAEAMLVEPRFLARHICWLAQQAAEKALKGALTLQQIPSPLRHDLDALRNLLPEGWQVKIQHGDLAELTQWAVEARYPGDWPEATPKHAGRAAEQARGVYDSVTEDLVRHGLALEPPQERPGADTA